jgi:hypothetical protein
MAYICFPVEHGTFSETIDLYLPRPNLPSGSFGFCMPEPNTSVETRAYVNGLPTTATIFCDQVGGGVSGQYVAQIVVSAGPWTVGVQVDEQFEQFAFYVKFDDVIGHVSPKFGPEVRKLAKLFVAEN